MLRGNIAAAMRVLDAGRGYGRNLVHLLRERCQVFGLDQDSDGVEQVRKLAASLGARLEAENFQVGSIERRPFPDASVDVVIWKAVLHFARNEEHFQAMVAELWPVLRPAGLLFCRLGSRTGMEFLQVKENRLLIGDGSAWFLVEEAMRIEHTEKLKAVLVDPLQTTIVQQLRCMTAWILRKRYRGAGPR